MYIQVLMVLYNDTTHIANDGSQMQYQLSIVPNGDISYMFCDKPIDKETRELIIMIVVMMRMRRIR